MENGFLISLLPNCEHAYKLNIAKVETDENIQCNDQKDINSTDIGSLSNSEPSTTSPSDKENNTGNNIYWKLEISVILIKEWIHGLNGN